MGSLPEQEGSSSMYERRDSAPEVAGSNPVAPPAPRAKVFRGERFFGLRVGRWYAQVKDTRFNPAYFSERNKHGCRHVTLGHWRVLLRWTRR